MRLLQREEMRVLLLDIHGRLIRVLRFVGGGIATTVVQPGDIFREAVRSGATGILLAHNHPGGDPEPSDEDLATTGRIASAGATLGIRLVDHIVVAARGHVSLKRRGLV